MPLWGWLLSGVGALVLLARSAMLRNRARVETEFVYYLQEHVPTVRFVRQEGKTMVLQHERAGEIRCYLHKLYVGAVRIPRADRAGRKKLYAQFAAALVEGLDPAPPDPAKLRPRLRTEAQLATLGDLQCPSRRLDELGLHLVYVLDAPSSVRYVTAEMAKSLGLDEPGLHARALANLAPSLSRETVRRALDGGALVVVKAMDGHDAARLLLVPALLEEGEALAAAIPDDNTLVLVRPRDGDFASVEKLAVAAGGPPLLRKAVRVTARGCAIVAT